MNGSVAAVLAAVAMVRLALFCLQQNELGYQFSSVEAKPAILRARRLLRAELLRVLACALLLILVANAAAFGLSAMEATVLVAVVAAAVEGVVGTTAMGSGLRGKRALLLIGAGLTGPVASLSSLLIAQLALPLWFMLTAVAGLVGIGLYLNCEWLFLRPRRERRAPFNNGALLKRLEALALNCGLASVQFVAVVNDDSTANMRAESDWFGRRVVIWPGLLRRLDGARLDAVILHELGHLALEHSSRRYFGTCALALLALLLSVLLAFAVVEPHSALFVAAVAAWLPLAYSSLRLGQFALYRRQELEADRFVREHGKGAELAQALIELSPSMESGTHSSRLHHYAYDSHPDAALRLAILRTPV
jgi:STE24 endopeptidase